MPNQDLHHAGALFARLIKLTPRREDFITECFAAVLQADGRAASAYWRIINGGLLDSMRTATGPIRVETQIRAGSGSSRLDMVVSRGRYRIGVEHKLSARQGLQQLPKYVALPASDATHIALVTGDYQEVSAEVLRSKRYARPKSGAAHFLWSDMYELVVDSKRRGVDVAATALGLFDSLGLQPAHRLIGDLRTTDQAERLKNDGRLFSAWRPLMDSLEPRWGFVGSSIRKDRSSEIYIFDGPAELLREVWLSPMRSPASLCVRLKTTSPTKRSELLAHIEEANLTRRFKGAVWEDLRLPPSARGNHWAIDVRLPWRGVLARATTRSALPGALKRVVLDVMASADPSAA